MAQFRTSVYSRSASLHSYLYGNTRAAVSVAHSTGQETIPIPLTEDHVNSRLQVPESGELFI